MTRELALQLDKAGRTSKITAMQKWQAARQPGTSDDVAMETGTIRPSVGDQKKHGRAGRRATNGDGREGSMDEAGDRRASITYLKPYYYIFSRGPPRPFRLDPAMLPSFPAWSLWEWNGLWAAVPSPQGKVLD